MYAICEYVRESSFLSKLYNQSGKITINSYEAYNITLKFAIQKSIKSFKGLRCQKFDT